MTREKKNPFIQRRKGDPIKYDGRTKPIPLAPEIRWDNAASCPSELTLEIKASPQDWDTLYLLSQASPEYLGKLIGFYVVRPVFEKFLAREGSNLPSRLLKNQFN